MSYLQHVPLLCDSSWIDHYIEKKGENDFWDFANKVYALLDKIEVGSAIEIDKWVKVENVDLFIKVATCYIAESSYCYEFKSDGKIIKHTWDKNEVEKIYAFFSKKREDKITKTEN